MHDIGTTTLYKLPINYKYMCVCLIWVSKCFGMVCCLFFKYNKTLQHGFIPYITFYLRCKCSTLWGARTHHNAMKRSMVNCLLYVRKTGYLLIVSSFKLFYVHRYISDILTFRGAFVLLFWLTDKLFYYICLPLPFEHLLKTVWIDCHHPVEMKEFNLKNHKKHNFLLRYNLHQKHKIFKICISFKPQTAEPIISGQDECLMPTYMYNSRRNTTLTIVAAKIPSPYTFNSFPTLIYRTFMWYFFSCTYSSCEMFICKVFQRNHCDSFIFVIF